MYDTNTENTPGKFYEDHGASLKNHIDDSQTQICKSKNESEEQEEETKYLPCKTKK